jgi:hypothetical protein
MNPHPLAPLIRPRSIAGLGVRILDALIIPKKTSH